MDLQCYRYAPVATRESGNHTPAQTGARALCVAGRYLYAHANRMGGSGWGTTIRLLKAREPLDGKEDERPSSVEEYRDTAVRALQSLEVIADSEGKYTLCASGDGSRVLLEGTAAKIGRTVGRFVVIDDAGK
jgi:hypothetical protein